MIQPQELRIGNLVYSEGKIREVGGISYDSVDLLVKPCLRFTQTVKIRRIDPIPLTEEWLVRLGFTPRKEAYWCLENGKIMVNIGNHFIVHVCGQVVSCQSVHQLQNLFYSLTGKELTYNI